MKSAAAQKIFYIDNLRILMTALVILHHTLIAYGAPGSWYFRDATSGTPALIIMTILVATNQSFFMGFFFFLSGYFTEPSYNKKGAGKFIADRLKRLGIPLLFYSFVLGPVMNFIVYRYGLHKQATFMQYIAGYDDWIDPGVMWFVAALLVFTFVYALLKEFSKTINYTKHTFPKNTQILVFAVALGVISFIVRIYFPVGWVLKPLGFQLAHFTQYISLFILGIVAYRNRWMENVSLSTGKRWLVIALIFILVVLPLMLVLNNSPMEAYSGHGTWQSFLAAMWEQLTGISIMVALSGIACQRWNYTTPALKHASRAAFATYIFHPLIVITITVLLLQWNTYPSYKVLIAVPVAIISSFFLGWLISGLPVVKNIV